MYIGHL